MTIKLYGSYNSPFVRHCRMALIESQQDFAFIETDAKQSTQLSPTQKVPFLTYQNGTQEIMLTDSSAILKKIREEAGLTFFQDVLDFDRFCLINTLLDTTVNLFLLEKEDITPANNRYLARQQARITTGLTEMNQWAFNTQAPTQASYTDSELRLACFLDWAVFRGRISLADYPNLREFLQQIQSYPPFVETAPKA